MPHSNILSIFLDTILTSQENTACHFMTNINMKRPALESTKTKHNKKEKSNYQPSTIKLITAMASAIICVLMLLML